MNKYIASLSIVSMFATPAIAKDDLKIVYQDQMLQIYSPDPAVTSAQAGELAKGLEASLSLFPKDLLPSPLQVGALESTAQFQTLHQGVMGGITWPNSSVRPAQLIPVWTHEFGHVMWNTQMAPLWSAMKGQIADAIKTSGAAAQQTGNQELEELTGFDNGKLNGLLLDLTYDEQAQNYQAMQEVEAKAELISGSMSTFQVNWYQVTMPYQELIGDLAAVVASGDPNFMSTALTGTIDQTKLNYRDMQPKTPLKKGFWYLSEGTHTLFTPVRIELGKVLPQVQTADQKVLLFKTVLASCLNEVKALWLQPAHVLDLSQTFQALGQVGSADGATNSKELNQLNKMFAKMNRDLIARLRTDLKAAGFKPAF